jgi:hypothetical protein
VLGDAHGQISRDSVIGRAIQHNAAASASEQLVGFAKTGFGWISAAEAVVSGITLIQEPAPPGVGVDGQLILLEPSHAKMRELLAGNLGQEALKCVQIAGVDPLGAVADIDQPARISTQPQPLVAWQLLVQCEIRLRRGVTAQVGFAA